ncbi:MULTISPECIES: hypothetical protein [unclassified Cyanobium]|uniref:hypothetical protein n=1 Tax=unclassified Cyanobium TaxID=2627006 RepID=UPI0020CE0FC0|nr:MULTISPECIES: hypothetical protein [unclassified Cyanobium]MCP9858567.1 hypothetical protein [Cyanobium sp. Cruz-8H5]MCP9865776.1 hypothetical protein [Cyanobium sp. Cruz-8D1]
MADPVPPASDLPAPYASPWGPLGRALRAVLASLRLRLRELWRRNREGDLSVPGFWPQGLAPLFWPLLLAALLALTLALAGKAWGRLSHRAPSPPPAARPAAPLLAPAPEEAPTVSVPARVAPAAVAARAPMPEPPPPPPPLELDPLLALLAQDDPEHLVASAHPAPSEGRLVLTMAPAYTGLSEATRRRWAERWQQRALALGYERLELVDGRQRLLARRALVGSGMILLDPGATG